MAVDLKTRRPVIGNVQGGVSDPAIKPIALLKCGRSSRSRSRIASVDDALEFLIAGVTTVGVGTALFYDPLPCPKINAGIAAYLRGVGMSSITELTESLVAGPARDYDQETASLCHSRTAKNVTASRD